MRTTVTNRVPSLLCVFCLFVATMLAGCASAGPPDTLFDFGPASPPLHAPLPAPLAPLTVADVSGAAVLDTPALLYRLVYADPQQAHAYANSRWNGTPLSLMTARLKTRLAQAGVKVLPAAHGAPGVALLHIELDEFAHHFASAQQSSGQLALRASVFQGRKLLDQRSFARARPAASADAAGGAHALANAVDAVCDDLIAWISAVARK